MSSPVIQTVPSLFRNAKNFSPASTAETFVIKGLPPADLSSVGVIVSLAPWYLTPKSPDALYPYPITSPLSRSNIVDGVAEPVVAIDFTGRALDGSSTVTFGAGLIPLVRIPSFSITTPPILPLSAITVPRIVACWKVAYPSRSIRQPIVLSSLLLRLLSVLPIMPVPAVNISASKLRITALFM